MTLLRNILSSIVKSGATSIHSRTEKRNVILSNYLALTIAGCLLIIFGYRVIIDQDDTRAATVLIFESVMVLFPIVMNRFGFNKISRIWLSWCSCLIVLFNSYLQLMVSSNFEPAFHMGIRFFLLSFACIPLLVFNLADWKSLAVALVVPVIIVTFYDPFLSTLQFTFVQHDLNDPVYTFNRFRVIMSYAVIALSIFFLKRTVEKSEYENTLLMHELDQKNIQLAEKAEADLRKSALELEASEGKFKVLVEQTLVGIAIIEGVSFKYVNPQLVKILGSTQEVLLRLPFPEVMLKDDREQAITHHMRCTNGTASRAHYRFRSLRSDGGIIHIEILASRIPQESGAVIATMVDITHQVEEEKRLSRAVHDAQERERLEIGMELHDNVNQMLLASLMNLDSAERLEKSERKDSLMTTVKVSLRDSIQELRRLSHQLAPSVGSTSTLEAKIKSIVDTINVTNRISVSYQFENTNEDVREDIQLAIYRILQEQFNNIIKHARATITTVIVKHEHGNVTLAVKDNGVGFDPSTVRKGIGLQNISRRVQALDGSMKINSEPDKGCELVVEIPANNPTLKSIHS